jgi:hypothetical protein
LYPPSGTKSIHDSCVGRHPFKTSLIMTRRSCPSPVRANLAGSDLSSAFLIHHPSLVNSLSLLCRPYSLCSTVHLINRATALAHRKSSCLCC